MINVRRALAAALLAASFHATAVPARADILFGFQANSVENPPLFTIADQDPGPNLDLTLTASNVLDLTVDVNGNTHTWTDIEFTLLANVLSANVIDGVGAFISLTDLTFSFNKPQLGLIVSASYPATNLFIPEGSTAATFFGSTPAADLYTQGPAFADFLASINLPTAQLGPAHDFSFTLANVSLVDGGPEFGGAITAESSFAGTATLVPTPASLAVCLLTILPTRHLSRRRPKPRPRN